MGTDLLIVDDDPFIRKLVTTTLRDVSGFTLHEAGDGIEALEQAAGLELGLAFLDVDMPRLDGIETCRRLRAGDGAKATIVMLTASEHDSTEASALAAGADRFLTKPFSPLELLELVESLSLA
jgi:two-component system chemotaxis response regulator CheY